MQITEVEALISELCVYYGGETGKRAQRARTTDSIFGRDKVSGDRYGNASGTFFKRFPEIGNFIGTSLHRKTYLHRYCLKIMHLATIILINNVIF